MPSKYPVPGKPTTAFCPVHAVEKIEKYLGAPGNWRVTEHWDRFPREVMESLHLRYSKPKPGTTLSHPLQMTLL